MVLSLNSYHSKSNQRAVVLHFFHFGQFFPILTISTPAKVIVAAIHSARATAAKLEIMDSLAFNNVSTFLASDCVPDNFRHDHSPFSAFLMVFCHNDQLSVVELLIAEIDDLRVTAVVFPQQRNRCILPYFQCRGQQTVGRKAITLIQGILLPNGIAGANVILCQHIGALLQVPDNYDIPRTGKCQHPLWLNRPVRPHPRSGNHR